MARYHPTVDGDYRPCFKYAGKGNLYYCPDCEAPEIRDKRTIVIAAGTANGGAGMSLGLSRYTSDLSLLVTGGDELDQKLAARLKKVGILVVSGEIQSLEGERGHLSALVLNEGQRLPAEAFFVSSPAYGRTDLALQLGVELASTKEHAQPRSHVEIRTSQASGLRAIFVP